MKLKAGKIVGFVVLAVIAFAVVKTYSVFNTDIPNDQVEAIATELKLVSLDEAEYPSVAEMEERVQRYRAGEAFTDVAVRLSFILFFVISILAVVLSVYKMLNNKQRLIRFAIPTAILLGLVGINWMMAEGSLTNISTTAETTEGEIKMVSALVSSTIFLILASVAFLIVLNFKKLLNK